MDLLVKRSFRNRCICQNQIWQLLLGITKITRAAKTEGAITCRDSFSASQYIGAAKNGVFNERGVEIADCGVLEDTNSTVGVIRFFDGSKGRILVCS